MTVFTPARIRWYNDADGAKIACVSSEYKDIPYGSTSGREFHAAGKLPHPEHGHFQWGFACSPSTLTIGLDGDYPDKWAATATGRLLGDWRDVATSVRELPGGGFKFHVMIQVPPELAHLWPKQLAAPFGHIKSKGFTYTEGMHATGTAYVLTGRPWLVADEALMLALLEDNGGVLDTEGGTARRDDYANEAAGWTDPDGAYPAYLGAAVLGDWVVNERNGSLPARCGIIKAAGEQGIAGMGRLFDDLCAEYDAETGRGDADVYMAFARSYPAYEKVSSLNSPPFGQENLKAHTASLNGSATYAPPGGGEGDPDLDGSATSATSPPYSQRALVFIKDEGGFQAATAATWVESQGPLRWGRDGQLWAHLGGVWVPGEDEVHRRVAYLLGNLYRRGHEDNIRELLRAVIGRIDCIPVPDVINFRNGLLYWREGDGLRPHDPGVLSTVQLPVDWKPGAGCPRFMQFLGEVLAPDDVMRALEMTGYLIRSGNPLHRLFLLYGHGRNGKGVLLRTLTALLGQDSISAVALHDLASDRFMPAELFGKTANLAGDIDATYIERTGQLKALSGEDDISAQRKFREPFKFRSWAVSVFGANKIPSSSDSSHGWLERWEVLPFPNTFATHDPELEPKLLAELEGIAYWAVEALRLLDKAGTFTRTAEGDEAKAVFAKGQDPLYWWLEECTRTDPAGWAKSTEAFSSYRLWAQQSEMKPLSKRNFYEEMRRKRGEVKRDGYPGYSGLVLLSQQPGWSK